MGSVRHRVGVLVLAAVAGGSLVMTAGCTKAFRKSVSQPNPLVAPNETLRVSEPIIIVTGDMELEVPRDGRGGSATIYHGQRYPLQNAAAFTVVSRDRLRFHVQIEHKWQEWTQLDSWSAYIVDDKGRRYVPEQVERLHSQHVVSMWDQEVRTVARNKFGDIVHVYNDGWKRRMPLGSLSVFRGTADLVFYSRNIFTPDVKSLTLVLERQGTAFHFTWKFADDTHIVGTGARGAGLAAR